MYSNSIVNNNGITHGLYNGGAVIFNSQPATQFYLQSVARQRAKSEALKNYADNYLSKLSPNGLRPQDIEGWYGRFGQLKDYYTQNASAIKNPTLDGGKAFSNYINMAKGMEAYAQQSKGLGDISMRYIAPIVTDPKKQRVITQVAQDNIHRHDLPIDDPNHQTFDPNSQIFDSEADKPFDIADAKKLDDMAGKIKMSSTISKETFDPKTKAKHTTFVSSYSPQDLRDIGSVYSSAYGYSHKFQNQIDDLVHNDPSVYDKYNQIFKGVYGHDMENNADLAAAWGLERKQRTMNKQVTGQYNPFTPADYEFEREKFANNQQGELNNNIDAQVDRQVQAAKDQLNSAWSSGVDRVAITADPATLKALNVEKLYMIRGSDRIIPAWTDKDGNEVTGTPMTIDDYKMASGKRNVGAKYFETKSKPNKSNSSSKTTSTSKHDNDPMGILGK